ncbi:hypothetical protein BGZ98_008799 [Dissophora globulifera]|nr:hypothetical protein BGZ98_008799 [Dissophora globulifera]
MSQQQQFDQDYQNLCQGRVRLIEVPFPEDPEWNYNQFRSYKEYFMQYHSVYGIAMPRVPALMTHYELTKHNETGRVHYSYKSKLVRPIKWIIDIDHHGLSAINCNENENYTVESVTEENVDFHAGIDLSIDTNFTVLGGYTPVKTSANLKKTIGTSLIKKVEVTHKKVIHFEAGCTYQSTRIYAKLLCEVIYARTGDFFCSYFGNLTTNASETGGVSTFKVSESPYIKLATGPDGLQGLHDAFGNTVSTHRDGSFLRGKLVLPKVELSSAGLEVTLSSTKINVVVDPADARLYITDTRPKHGTPSDTKATFSVNFPVSYTKLREVSNMNGKIHPINLSQDNNYYGLEGTDDIKENTKIPYLLNDKIKVWRVLQPSRDQDTPPGLWALLSLLTIKLIGCSRAEIYDIHIVLAFLTTEIPHEKFKDILITLPYLMDGATGNKVTEDIKYFVYLGRENRIHDSPTALWNGTIESSFSSD